MEGDALTPEQILKNTNVNDINRLQHVVLLRDTATVYEALKVLANHRILSAPVVTGGADDKGQGAQYPQNKPAKEVMGFVDLRDIISSFFAELDMDAVSNMRMLQRMSVLEEKGTQFCQKQLKDIKVMGGDGTFMHQQQANITILNLINEGFLKPKQRGLAVNEMARNVVHRVAIFSTDGLFVNLVSQTDIIRYILECANDKNGILERPVSALKLGTTPVQSTLPEASAFEVLKKLDQSRISGVAVCSSNGRMVGNFSISEMRTFVAEHFGALALPVGEFLALEHGTEYAGYGIYSSSEDGTRLHGGHKDVEFARGQQQRRRVSIAGQEVGQHILLANEDTTLREVMELIVQHRVHRVYVCSDEDVPIKVITMTDILYLLVALAEGRQLEAQT